MSKFNKRFKPKILQYVSLFASLSLIALNACCLFNFDSKNSSFQVSSEKKAKVKNSAENIKASKAQTPSIVIGKEIIQKRCIFCHSIDGSRLIGPSFKDLYLSKRQMESEVVVVADRAHLLESISEPARQLTKGYPNVMPKENFSPLELESMYLYLQTLSKLKVVDKKVEASPVKE